MRLLEGTPFDRPPRCEQCGELEEDCTCPPAAPSSSHVPPEKQTARLALEKRKRGKMVSVVRGLSPAESDLPELLTRLKTSCGAGGTLKDGVLEIQGQHVERIRDILRGLGYRVSG
ncbi:MAG TPA: translation initiation factor [Planctomycetaceae bacterium]|nr:translation initiation factor [Planctomycetaceae bacterium]